MDAISKLVGFILHFDEHLRTIIDSCGPWTYAILFAIIFCETGLVVMPFLPGDSLLFAAGALAARFPESLGLVPLLVVLLLGVGLLLWVAAAHQTEFLYALF